MYFAWKRSWDVWVPGHGGKGMIFTWIVKKQISGKFLPVFPEECVLPLFFWVHCWEEAGVEGSGTPEAA